MLLIFVFILSGVFVGYISRKTTLVKHVGSFINVIIVLLLFFLGIAVGANRQIVDNFAHIGLDAFAIAFGATTGSLLCAWMVYKRFFKEKKGSK